MAVLRMRDGDSIQVREEYRDASTKFGNALHNGLLLELTIEELVTTVPTDTLSG
jgi:hypothetical protein